MILTSEVGWAGRSRYLLEVSRLNRGMSCLSCCLRETKVVPRKLTFRPLMDERFFCFFLALMMISGALMMISGALMMILGAMMMK
ncbi:hypothetical protein DN757_02875 [Paenibacillus silvae]|uniref:Uncharacterized protein n=1 Tax=Paenibacillus silvae TaxID=1325358 RepID=A0A2W6NN57_9BACL|nr:hypothetical protein DN757_02875 [Paenibacillus silvae]